MKTRIVMKSFDAFSIAVLTAMARAGGDTDTGGSSSAPPCPAVAFDPGELTHVPAPPAVWIGAVDSALNDL